VLDADDEIQVNAFLGEKAVLEVACKARVGGSMNALWNRTPEESRGVCRFDDVHRHPATVADGEAFQVGAEGVDVVLADCGAHGEWDEGGGQKRSFHAATEGVGA
jgi:hypothetical protein